MLSQLLGVRIVGFLDAPVVRATGRAKGVVDGLGVDVAVEQVIEQGFELPAVLIGAWHAYTIDGLPAFGQ